MTDKLTIGVHHIGLTPPGYGGVSSEGLITGPRSG